MVKNLQSKILSNNWGTLKKISYDYLVKDIWQNHTREVYDRGNGATILLFNPTTQKVILTRQFRLPTFLNGNQDGHLIEACAGMLEDLTPEDCVRREALEETGYQVEEVTKLFSSYMSPGAVTEIIHFYLAHYNESMKINAGGGLDSEQENIEVIEMSFDEAYKMIESGQIQDAKTIMLLQHLKIKLMLH